MTTLIVLPVTALHAGDIVRFHGARFAITRTKECRGHIDGLEAYGTFDAFVGPSPVAAPIGKWIAGHVEPGYFGPSLDWTFQGNALARVAVEPRGENS